MCTLKCYYLRTYNYISSYLYHFSKISGTHAACGIVAGAAALVLEKHKDYTPAEVKQHLLSEATDGVVEMPRAFDMLLNRDVNKFLYVGNDSGE